MMAEHAHEWKLTRSKYPSLTVAYCKDITCKASLQFEQAEAMLNEYGTLRKATETLSAEIASQRGCVECWTGKSCGADCNMQDIADTLEGK